MSEGPDRQTDCLRAHALTELITGQPGSGHGAEVVVVIDLTQPVTEIDWGIPVELPATILHELLDAASTEIHGVVIRNGVIISAPGILNLGRTTRLANRAQRRALRGVHRTCVIPDCAVRFGHCKIHHVHWWRHGGLTHIDNLVPVCPRHHAAIHTEAITIELGPQHTVTITDPHSHNVRQGPHRNHAPP